MKTKTILSKADLLKQAREVGWNHSQENSTVLLRDVPWKTRDTFYTWVCKNNGSATEFISLNNLQYCGKNSRAWRRM